ncbi:PadR family transcriptional regulator [Herpetosiphon llansteffanensis]|uniref:PadR family transcriptional regulator n=1 Tax=Herpetosiphon llansteffanensis TaxID=2094568 RepID=UPI000D7D1530|nr:helix-turn-helix transcriptional regulator [Herpetosiphon llansteffanensis]
MSVDLTRGDLPTLILSVLTHGPLHGYAIARAIERDSDQMLRMREGSLYPALRTLENSEWVTSSWEIQAQGPARKVYHLTAAGLAELENRIAAWRRYATAIEALMGKRRLSYDNNI